MKKIVDDDRLIYKCCNLYYMKNKTQVEICNTLGLSRATVSRMLALGREQGIVKIEVINPAAGIIFNPPRRDIPLKGKELNTHKNGKTGPV